MACAADAFTKHLENSPKLSVLEAEIFSNQLNNLCSLAFSDGIPPYIVKDCSSVFISPSLHVYIRNLYIFNVSLTANIYPDQW